MKRIHSINAIQKKKKQITAIVCVFFVVIILALFFHNQKKEPVSGKEKEDFITEDIAENLTTGAEVKEQLQSLSTRTDYAVFVVTQDMMVNRTCNEPQYIKYVVDKKHVGLERKGESGIRYTVFYENYGSVIKDTLICHNSYDGFYTMFGFLEADEIHTTYSEKEDAIVTIIGQKKIHNWEEENSTSIPDEELFEQSFLTDENGNEIGYIYTTYEIQDTTVQEE